MTESPQTKGISKQLFSSSPKDGRVQEDRHHSNMVVGTERLSLWEMVLREARAVSVWATMSFLFRIFVGAVVHMASDREDCMTESSVCESTSIPKGMKPVLRFVAGWILTIAAPHKTKRNMAPGFVYGSPWLLFYVRDTFGAFPNIPLRISEAILGRISIGELILILPVHFFCTLSTLMACKRLLTADLASFALAPIVYSAENPWFMDFVRELSVTCAFAIAVLVVPELLALNNISRWVMCLFLYPMFNFSVDAKAMGSAFAPNVLYTLSALNEEQDDLFFRGPSLGRFVGSICGGVLAGKVMKRCFPDDPKES